MSRDRTVALVFLGNALLCSVLFIRTQQAFFVLLGIRAILTASCYWHRIAPSSEASWIEKFVALASAALPFLYQSETASSALLQKTSVFAAGNFAILAGTLLSVWGIAALGPRFSITPANRGRVVAGPYRWMNHPIYTGYLISEAALALTWPSPRNVILLVFSAALYALRANWETTQLQSTKPADTRAPPKPL